LFPAKLFHPFHRVFNVRVNQFNWANLIEKAQQIFSPVSFGFDWLLFSRYIQRINQQFRQFLPFLRVESVFVNAPYKTLTLNPSPSGRGTYPLLHEGEGLGMRVKVTVIFILQTHA